ncbi:MAG: hypothetical protein NVSMB9_26160 [Isosphaeraceae bacterium]
MIRDRLFFFYRSIPIDPEPGGISGDECQSWRAVLVVEVISTRLVAKFAKKIENAGSPEKPGVP